MVRWRLGGDVLAGKQTRKHRNIDINFDSRCTNQLLEILIERGYEIVVDLRPVRIELYHMQHSYIDIHPFVLNENGTAKQADLDGGFYEFEAAFEYSRGY